MNAPQLPAHLQRFQARDVGATLSHNLGTAAPPYVSIAGNRFTLIDAAGNEQPVPTFDPQIGVYLDAVIIDANEHLSRTYYAQKYDPSAATFNPPDCWSDNGTAPSISCSSPQARSCTPDPEGIHGCKWAVWGSATSAQGKAVPACQQLQKLALLIPGSATLFLLRVPPNSHKHLRAYQETCKGSGVMVADVITRIYFDQSTQGTLLFKGVNYIDEPTAVLRQAAYTEKKTDTLVGRTDVARVPALAAPVQQGAIPAQMPPPRQQFLQSSPTVTGSLEPNAYFVPPPTTPAQPSQPAESASQAFTGAGFATPPTPPSEPAQPVRRRRRTAAEMQAAQQAPVGQAPQQPAAAPVAPFPVPGQSAPAAPATFGIAQPSPASAELSSMLDDFFKG